MRCREVARFPTRRSPRRRGPRCRSGVALVFVLVLVIAMAALAMSSIFMASNATLLAKSYDRERDLKFAAEAALAMGKSRVNADPNILALNLNQVDTSILRDYTITGADGKPMSGVRVNVYVGPTGSTSGQFGRFSSIVAEARDARGNGFIRRLELAQESFAKFAYWSNVESNSSQTIFFNNGDELWGPVWSNDTISIGAGGAIFHDEVGTAAFVSGASYGVFSKGRKERQKPIRLPTNTVLSKLATLAASSGWSFTSGAIPSSTETNVRDRVEFVAFDLNGVNDSTDANEGAFRVFSARSGLDARLRGDWPGTSGTVPSVSAVNQCGDWHWAPRVQSTGTGVASAWEFYPAAVHKQPWFYAHVKQGYIDRYGVSVVAANDSAAADTAATLKAILTAASARCWLAGDPHLVAVERSASFTDPRTRLPYPLTSMQRGGTDTTFTAVGVAGSWALASASPAAAIRTARPWDAAYLFPIHRSFNPNAKGVMFFTGNVGLSGVVNGLLTLYANGSIVLLDDLRYANDPVKGVCRDILGLISDRDIVIADNALNTPPVIDLKNKTPIYYSLDDTKDFYIHAVLMALGTSFRVQNYAQGPTNVNDCNGVSNGRGCIYLSGGIIQERRGPVGTSLGTGYTKRYSYDRCAAMNPPPYFPTTGRFQDNRYLELDPAGFDHVSYYKSLTPLP